MAQITTIIPIQFPLCICLIHNFHNTFIVGVTKYNYWRYIITITINSIHIWMTFNHSGHSFNLIFNQFLMLVTKKNLNKQDKFEQQFVHVFICIYTLIIHRMFIKSYRSERIFAAFMTWMQSIKLIVFNRKNAFGWFRLINHTTQRVAEAANSNNLTRVNDANHFRILEFFSTTSPSAAEVLVAR